MKIIGFNFKKINIERKEQKKGQVQINTNIDVPEIKKEKIDIAGEVLRISFKYSINYSPKIADIVFEGNLLFIPDDIKKILKEWKKKKISQEIKIPIFNFIMSKCNIKALQLEEDFGLPPHIPLPKISKQRQANYTS
jgi:hypothetical protein